MRFAANRLASHLESVCNRANWSTIRAKFKSRSSYDTARLLSTRFQTAAPSLPPLDGKHRGDGWKAGNNPCGRNTRSPNSRTLFYLICLFLFLSILVPSFFPSSRNSIRVSVRLKENGILRFTGIVSLLLTSIIFAIIFFSTFQAVCCWVKKKENSRGIVLCFVWIDRLRIVSLFYSRVIQLTNNIIHNYSFLFDEKGNSLDKRQRPALFSLATKITRFRIILRDARDARFRVVSCIDSPFFIVGRGD